MKRSDNEDLSGKTFGYWTVLEKAPNLRSPDGTSRVAYKCKCICGNTKIVAKSQLIRGKSKSCACKGVFLSPGDKFQEWVVIEKDSIKHPRNRQFYLCQCSCGVIRSVSMMDLIYGHSCNCGHSRYTLSKGANAIKDFLVTHNYDFYQEYMFKNFPKRYYDFALYNKNNPDQIIRLIEFDGEQHLLTSKSTWHNEALIKRDREKNQFALINKIPLVRIPYYKISISADDLFTDKYEVKE